MNTRPLRRHPSAGVLIVLSTLAALAACDRRTEQGGSQGTSPATTQRSDPANPTLGTGGAQSQNSGGSPGVSGTHAGGSTTGIPGAGGMSPVPGDAGASAPGASGGASGASR